MTTVLQPVVGGLCHYIVDPVAHRAFERKQGRPEVLDDDGNSYSLVLDMLDCLADDEWVCEVCNGSLDATQPVPLIGDNTLCYSCAAEHGHPRIWWYGSYAVLCLCGGCLPALQALVDEHGPNVSDIFRAAQQPHPGSEEEAPDGRAAGSPS